MKASLIILTGASTVSAMWLPGFCCGGFPSPEEPRTTTTAATTTTTTAATKIPDSTFAKPDLDETYSASSIDKKPTTLSTSIMPTKSADAGSIPIDNGLDFVIDPITDAEINVYPIKVPQNIYSESFSFSDEKELGDLFGSDSDSDVDSDSGSKQTAGETNPTTDATRVKIDILMQDLLASGSRLKDLTQRPQKLQATEDMPSYSEISSEEGFSFPTLPQTADPDAATPRMGNGEFAGKESFGGFKCAEDQDEC